MTGLIWFLFLASVVVTAGYWVFITGSTVLHYFGGGHRPDDVIAEERSHLLDETRS